MVHLPSSDSDRRILHACCVPYISHTVHAFSSHIHADKTANAPYYTSICRALFTVGFTFEACTVAGGWLSWRPEMRQTLLLEEAAAVGEGENQC